VNIEDIISVATGLGHCATKVTLYTETDDPIEYTAVRVTTQTGSVFDLNPNDFESADELSGWLSKNCGSERNDRGPEPKPVPLETYGGLITASEATPDADGEVRKRRKGRKH